MQKGEVHVAEVLSRHHTINLDCGLKLSAFYKSVILEPPGLVTCLHVFFLCLGSFFIGFLGLVASCIVQYFLLMVYTTLRGFYILHVCCCYAVNLCIHHTIQFSQISCYTGR